MKKKFTFLLTALLLITGTAMQAQTIVTAINTAKRYTLECRSGAAHSDARFIADNGTVLDGHSATPTYISFENAGTAGAYYIKSDVTGKYLNYNTTSANGLSMDTERATVWTLGVPSHTAGVVTFTIGDDKYLNNNGTDGACTNLKTNYHNGGPGSGNACSLWEMREYDRLVDYTPHVTGERTQNTGRQVTAISIASEAFAEETANTYTLTEEERRLVYLDLTERVTMKAKAGEAVAPTLSKIANWVNAYVYVDYEADGFTASLGTDGYSPAEDLVSYSFYSGDDNNDNNGHNYNSAGTIDDRNTVALPAFSAPSTAGTYRMRFKMDWNSIDPAGDQNSSNGDFTTNGGAIIDVMLEVEGTDEDADGLESKIISLGEAVTTLVPGNWYMLYNHSRNCYVSEETTAFKMRSGKPADGTAATEIAGKLFKLTAAETEGQYYLMSGNGLYFDFVENNTSSVSENPVAYRINAIGDNTEGHFYIQHAGNGNIADGQGDGYNFVCWGNTIPTETGGNNCYHFEKVSLEAVSLVEVTYEYVLDGELVNSQTTRIVAGSTYPDFQLPYGVSTNATKPEGTVSEDKTIEIEVTITLPFSYAADNGSITDWYYIKMHTSYPKYLEYLSNDSYIEWTDESVAPDFDSHAWAFVGNPFDGFKLVNMAATTGRALKSTGTGNATMDSYDNGTRFIAKATSVAPSGGFCLQYPDGNYLNAQSGKLAHWWDNDAGSTMMVEPCGEALTIRVAINAYIEELSAGIGALPLQTSNASGEYYLSATQYGDAPISAAIDKDPSTHYGSTWQSVVGSTHYWQVDLGEGVTLNEFVFSYITRKGNDIPTRLNVKGSTDGASFTEMVSLGSELPTTGGATYTSATIDNSKGYRYIRFEVPSTVNNYSFAGNPEQEVTISIAEFSMRRTDGQLSDQDKALLAVIAEAQEVVNNINATVEELNEAYKDLKIATAEKPVYPFTITTDDASPILYAIRSGRTNNNQQWWYTYNEADGMISLTQFTRDDAQYWYFKEVITEDYEYALQLYPYLGGGKAMSYQDTSNGPAKVVAKAPGTEGYTNYWRFVTTGGNTPYGLQTYDRANYLSNNGGVVNKMGMWTGSPAADGGTAMYISEAHTWTIIPGEYPAGVNNAENETHKIDDQLTIYTSYCHWGDDLTIHNNPYKGEFYSNELYAAIKSITFSASCEGEETLLVYGSNDGENWTLTDEVSIPCEEGTADFSGTTFNYFKVETKGFNNVSISKLVIKVDPTVELPLIVDEPAFNIAGGNLYEPAKLELSSEQGADIYWSTDGENYEAYDEEIEIDATCTIYAYAEIDGVESKVVSETYVVAAEYENIAAMQAAVEATEEGMPVVIDLQAIITEVGEKQISINDNTAELLVSDNYLPDYYAVKDTLCGKLRGVYKLVKGQPTVCELDYAYLSHKIFVLTEAPELEGQFFTVGNATSVLKEYTWYLLRNVNRNAYVNETDVDLRMLPTTSITSMSAADDNLGVLFHLEKSENGEDLYTICSGKGNYFTIAQSSSTISAAAVDYLIKNISGNTFYIQDPATGVVVDGNAAGGTFVGWGTTVPTGTNGNNVYQFMEVEFVDAEKAASIVKASGILNELQQEYGLVTDASQYSSNAVETTEGSLAALLDNDYATFFHSSWSQTVEGTHYLQAEVSKPTKSLFFYFKKRSQNNNNRPTDITILGSNDGVNFTEVTRINSGLPTDAGTLDYTSSVIKATQAYKHFRFMVNATGGDSGNTQFFTFSEFYILPGESVYRNVITAANALLSAEITNKNFDKLVAAFEAACAKLKGEDEKPPVTPTGKKVVYDLNVERITGMGYAADDHYITTDKLTALLGGKKLEGAAIWGVNPDGTYVADAMATYDGWRDADGAFAYWGESAVVCAKLFQEEGSYLVELCTFPANDPEAGTKYTASWALIAGQDTVVINTNITFVAPTVINIANYEVVATMKVEHNEAANTAYSGNTAAFDAAAAAKALGVASLDDAGQYILNVTTGDLVLNTTDGWRDNKGDAAGWGNAGGVCVKIQSPSTGSIDYIGCYDDTHAAGETYTAKWAFVSGNKAAIVEVVITFIDASSISDINVDQPVTAYTISGKAIQTTSSGVKNLQRGIYIINGKKVYVK